MIGRIVAAGVLAFLPLAGIADEENPAIEYRQSLMNLFAMNFGPIAATVEGKIPWDDAQVAGWGKDLEAVAGLNALRGFVPGTEGGHAQPELWSNMEDFRSKMESMQLEAAKLGTIAQGSDRAAIGTQLAATGKACKACHDEYKKKDD